MSPGSALSAAVTFTVTLPLRLLGLMTKLSCGTRKGKVKSVPATAVPLLPHTVSTRL